MLRWANIGVNLEVAEALRILEGDSGPNSLMQKSAALAGMALEMTGKTAYGYGSEAAIDLIRSGKALAKMRDIIEVQGGDPKIKSSDLLFGSNVFDVPAPNDGYVVSVKNRELINIARTAGSPADHGAGLHLHKKPGEAVKKGEPILTIYAERGWRLQRAIEELRRQELACRLWWRACFWIVYRRSGVLHNICTSHTTLFSKHTNNLCPPDLWPEITYRITVHPTE